MWTPRQLSGGTIYAWYDASVFDTLTLVNSGGFDYVSQWNSIIGGAAKSLTQTTSGRRPFYRISPYSKKPCVRFDHSNSDTSSDFLDGFNIGGFGETNAQLHMFTACRQTDLSLIVATGDTTEVGMTIFGYEGYHGNITVQSDTNGYQRGISSSWWNSSLTVSKSATIVISQQDRKLTCFGATVYGGTSGTWYVSSHFQNYVTPVTSTTEASNRRIYPYVNCRVGTSFTINSTYAYPFGGELYELILITGTITLNTKTKMLEYLNAKWGP
jgi:hypothetical protein